MTKDRPVESRRPAVGGEMSKKSLRTAYFLWLTTGFLGGHHFYLDRDDHGWLTLITFGGCFGIGWLRDGFNLYEYVNLRNGVVDPQLQLALRELGRHGASTADGTTRIFAEFVMGTYFGYLTRSAIPNAWLEQELCLTKLLIFAVPFAVAFAVYTIANIGATEASFRWCFVGAYVPLVLYIIDEHFILCSAIGCTWLVNQKGLRQRQHLTAPPHFCWRTSRFAALTAVYVMLLGCTLYYNTSIVYQGQQHSLKDFVDEFLQFTGLRRSRRWEDFKSNGRSIYQYVLQNGTNGLWSHIMSEIDPLGTYWSYRALGFSATDRPSELDIKARYRQLVREWHPDKFADASPSARRAAEEKFMLIEKAYEVLSVWKQRRTQVASQTVAGDQDRSEL